MPSIVQVCGEGVPAGGERPTLAPLATRAQRQLQQVSLALPPEDPHAGGGGEEGLPLHHHEGVGHGAGPGGAGVSHQVLPQSGASGHRAAQVLQPGEAGEGGSQGHHQGGGEEWLLLSLQPTSNTSGQATRGLYILV